MLAYYFSPKAWSRTIQAVSLLIAILITNEAIAKAPLHSWKDTPIKARLLHFIDSTTEKGSPYFVEPEARIAVFDNDGSLWVEKPMYIQLYFMKARLKSMAKQNPEIKKTYIYQSIMHKDMDRPLTKKDFLRLFYLTHSNITLAQFKDFVQQWSEHAKHPEFDCKFERLAYQPMLELLAYLRAKGYKNYIVTGGGVEFVRAFSQRLYGIPSHRVIGSMLEMKLVKKNGKYQFMRLANLIKANDKEVKPLSIQQIIGARPIISVGNSDGDLAMLQYTSEGKVGLPVLIWHTDATREYAYDKHSRIGNLNKALDAAKKNNWLIIDMKKDWKHLFNAPECKRLDKSVIVD